MAIPAFEIRETITENGIRRLTLRGELELRSAPVLRSHLAHQAQSGEPACLDLSQLEFMDSTGIALLVGALKDAREHGRCLEIDCKLSPHIAPLVRLTGVGAFFWPESDARAA